MRLFKTDYQHMWHMKMNYRMYNLMLTVYLNGQGKTGKNDQCTTDLLYYDGNNEIGLLQF